MKKRFSRMAAIFLSASLLAGALPYSASAASFSDVPSDSWYAPAVTDLVDRGVIQGTGPTTFTPGGVLTRGAFVTMLAKTVLSQGDLDQYRFKGSFKDVAETHWSNPAVNWASETGIVKGYSNNTFQPNSPVSRQEMAVMVVNFSKATGRKIEAVTEPVSFADSASVANYAASSVKLCQQAGIINGYKADNTFRPKGVATRAEAASLYARFLKTCTVGNYQIVQKRVYTTPVKAVLFDPDAYSAGLAMGRDMVDGGEEVTSLVSRTGAKIAANAAFFNMKNYLPLGTLISEGRVLTVDNSYAPEKAAFAMDANGVFSIESFSTLHSATLQLADEEPITIQKLAFNRWPNNDKDATRIIFTRDWGHTLAFTAKDAVTVDENGVILSVDHDKDVDIPENGYVIAQKARREYEGEFFDSCQVGDVITLERTYEGASTQNLVLSIGAGPRIVKDGQVYGGQSTYRAEGFTDPNIIQYNARRIAIGIRGDGSLVLLTANTTLEQLSKIMVSFGCTDAINFDGGGSANLYVDGQWLWGPQERKLNSMLYFK